MESIYNIDRIFPIGDKYVPVVNIGESFTYLGKHFDFNMDNQKAKQQLKDKLTVLLRTTSGLDIKPQQKLEILKKFIPTQLSFELRIYDFSYTWIEQTLDSLIANAVRDWMTFPISTCVNGHLRLKSYHRHFSSSQRKPFNNSFQLLPILWDGEKPDNLPWDKHYKIENLQRNEICKFASTCITSTVTSTNVIVTSWRHGSEPWREFPSFSEMLK